MKFIKTNHGRVIHKLRSDLYARFMAPLDAMWESLYIASAQPYLIEELDQPIGFCCIDEEDSLLQIYLVEAYNHLMHRTIKSLIDSGLITSAKLSSIEPISFNACLTISKSIQTNTLCFHYSGQPMKHEPLNIVPVHEGDIPEVRTFLKEQIGFDDTFGYTANLVTRQELFMIKEKGDLMATSERRMSDSQPGFADLGVIVNRKYQGRGLATRVLNQQAENVLKLNRRPICSTTHDNVASQKAIEKAGFYCAHIIFDIQFL